MRHILLTWNPGPNDSQQWTPASWVDEMVEPTLNGGMVRDRWNAGNRVRGIDPGDRAYLLRQGSHGRGIVAAGEIRSTPYEDKHWRGDGSLGRYVDIAWEECRRLEDMLPLEELRSEVPDFKWNYVLSSGRDLAPHGAKVEALWTRSRQRTRSTQADNGLPPVERDGIAGGGLYGDAEQNALIEKAAVDFVTAEYESAGYTVESVEQKKCGWDLTVVGVDEQLHVEVKGVSGSLATFLLTANEYQAAAADPKWLLVVVTDALSSQPQWIELEGASALAYSRPDRYVVYVPAADLLTIDDANEWTKP